MKFSAVVTLQYDTVFSPFSVQEWKKGLDWMQESGLDGAGERVGRPVPERRAR